MKTLGIDYGQSKIGIAVGVGTLSEPLKVIRVSSFADALEKIKKEIEIENPDKVVVGVSEAAMGEESKKFAQELGATTFDETLTSRDAQKLSIEAGISRKKRHQMEDAYAASLMLQNYLDTQKDW
ncbi:MAG TPA: Holliday junction resolvase RuvX [Patescibacteria group bacterium]|nr:Holliday junction resolvase RuvX [Patescibacteria group bacterium]